MNTPQSIILMEVMLVKGMEKNLMTNFDLST